MWNPCWFHMNIYELCNQTGHMDCFNACLLWQKLGSIKWQGLTPCMTYKMAQGRTGGDKCGLAKARVYKMTGSDPLATAGVPCWHYAALSFSSGLLCFWLFKQIQTIAFQNLRHQGVRLKHFICNCGFPWHRFWAKPVHQVGRHYGFYRPCLFPPKENLLVEVVQTMHFIECLCGRCRFQ